MWAGVWSLERELDFPDGFYRDVRARVQVFKKNAWLRCLACEQLGQAEFYAYIRETPRRTFVGPLSTSPLVKTRQKRARLCRRWIPWATRRSQPASSSANSKVR